MGQNHLLDKSLTFKDKRIRKLINKKFPIDKNTFCNVTPESNYPYWIGSLRRYQAMGKDWIVFDPPGPPVTFFVTPSSEIFLDIKEALHAIKYEPKDNEDALKVAIIIAHEVSPMEARVIIDNNKNIDGIPESILSKYNITPSIVKINQVYTIVVFSCVSREYENRFVHAYHALYKHLITIEGDTYRDTIKTLWEKKGE